MTAMLLLAQSTCAQEFRQPNINLGDSAEFGNQDLLSLAPASPPQQQQRAHQNFVPGRTDGGLELGPVKPRGKAGNGPTLLRPDFSTGRSGEQERIIDQIRSGNFDNGSNGIERRRGSQIVRQRYENGRDQLVRHVMQDEDGNYFNHGPWRLYNRRGEVVASGQFANGAMDGTWERWHQSNSSGMFSTEPFTRFQGPFLSNATFSNGKLNGVWVITDQSRRKIVEVPYVNGKRNGTAIWWFPENRKMRVINFKEGILDGPLFEWDAQQKLVRNEEFIRGHKVVLQTTAYRPQQKSEENYFLDSKLELDGEDSWWDAEPAQYVESGERFQHGPAFAWYPNGQRKMAGQYREDVRVGSFLWWHDNGQRALAGRYEDGLKTGTWIWWHENGMKSIEGIYDSDQTVGEWTWWDEQGQVANREDYGDGSDSTGELINPFDGNSPSADGAEDDGDASESGMAPFKAIESGEGGDEFDEQESIQDTPPESGLDGMEEINPQEIPGMDDEVDEGSGNAYTTAFRDPTRK